MFEVYEKLKVSDSGFDQLLARQFENAVASAMKPLILGKGSGKVVRWKIDEGGENDRKSD
jgi:hypothetical protein